VIGANSTVIGYKNIGSIVKMAKERIKYSVVLSIPDTVTVTILTPFSAALTKFDSKPEITSCV
jgi:hypothetical protein